jgi:hypothetical protein
MTKYRLVYDSKYEDFIEKVNYYQAVMKETV